MFPSKSTDLAKRYYKQRKWKWQPKKLIAFISAMLTLFLLSIIGLYYAISGRETLSIATVFSKSATSTLSDQPPDLNSNAPNQFSSDLSALYEEQKFAVGGSRPNDAEVPSPTPSHFQSFSPTPIPETQTVSALTTPLPVLIFTFNRAENLKKTIDSVLEHRSPQIKEKHPILVSQDGDDQNVNSVVQSFGDQVQEHLRFEFREPSWYEFPGLKIYYKIAQHYGWALKKVFDEFKFYHVILLEDDMLISPDFFSYFTALSPVVDRDPTIFCASGWNDRGQERFVRSHSEF